MVKRKTFDVVKFKNWVNSFLALPTKDNPHVPSQDEKRSLCTAVEMVLMDTGNYRGFNPIKWCDGGCASWQDAGQPEDKKPFLGEEYDRFYY
jgi:hypothetical protein